MLKLGRIFKDHSETGSLNTLLALWGFVDEHAFLTKAGHVGLVYRVRGVDFESLTHADRHSLVHRLEAALRLLDEPWRVYQYLIKRTIDPIDAGTSTVPVASEALRRRAAFLNSRRGDLYELVTYAALVYEAPHVTRRSFSGVWRDPRRAVSDWLSPERQKVVLERELDAAIAHLHQTARAFEVQLSDFGLQRMSRREAFAFFRTLLNYNPSVAGAASLAYDTHLDYFVVDSMVDCHRDHLIVGDRTVRVLSMKEPPAQTFAFCLEGLCDVRGEFLACLEWQRLSNDRVRRDLHARRRHFFNKRVSLVNYVSPSTQPDEMLVDDSASATVRQLGEALTEVEVGGRIFGSCSLTVVLHDVDPRVPMQQASEVRKVAAAHDASFYEENYNLLNAWLSVVPGNGHHNLRRLALLDSNLADLSFLFTLDQGERMSPHLNRGALAVFETPHRTPYFYNLHVQDVGHTLVLGATGAGKSFLLNFLVTHAQQYMPHTFILDIGRSYRKLATLLGGSYLELGVQQQAVSINPFAFDPTPGHLHFVHSFVRLLLEGEDSYRLSELEDRELYEAVENVYVLERGQRRLFTLANLLPRPLSGRLHKWVNDGRYAQLFDNIEDTLSLDRLQVFEFEAMRAYPVLLEAVLFYVLHRITTRLHDPSEAGVLKLCILDEAWRFIQHPTLRSYVEEGLKTWRKHNAAMLLATQTVDDFASPELLRTVIESCPTKLLLANPGFDRKRFADLFQLNDMELDLLAGLLARQQVFLKRATLAKVLSLNVDPRTYWIYTNTPIDNERVAQVFREHGFEVGLDRLAASA
jgi:type IV secretion system protein TrbE